jgi:parallel beta-helix repeat protein
MSLFQDRNRRRAIHCRHRENMARRRLLRLECLENRRVLTGNPELVVSVADGTGPGTIYDMIQVANAQPGPDRIAFASEIITVRPGASLPWISDELVLDGANRVTLDGSGSPSDGLMINGSGVQIVNLTVANYSNGNGIFFLGASNGKVQGSRIGTDQAGLVANPSRMGILVHNSSNVVIGIDGDGFNDANEGNLISGNTEHGLQISGSTTQNNVVAGNVIGYKTGGTEALPNGAWAALVIRDGAKFNRIGTDGNGVSDLLERNLVTVTAYANGIAIHNASDNIVSGNYAGVDVTGSFKVGNLNTGVAISGGSARNIVGVKDDGSPGEILEGNLLTAGLVGVSIADGSSGNQVSGNLIGTDSTGKNRLNVAVGVILQAPNNIIGTDGDGQSDALERNIISGGTEWGMRIDSASASGNRIAGNYIGTDITGAIAIGSEYAGIGVTDGASSNLIGTNGDGTSDDLERNVISGNKGHGIVLSQNGTNNNTIAGNYLGINALGNAALPNQAWSAIVIQSGVSGTRIGADGNGKGDLAERNIISGSAGHGIYIAGSQTRVAGNWIGLDATGTFAVPNKANGISLGEGAQGNILGIDGDGSSGESLERNVISGNQDWAITLGGLGTSHNRVSGNYIGTSIDGLNAIPNRNGIAISDRASSNIIGTNGDGMGDALEGNLISGNSIHAVYIDHVGSNDNTISGNLIGTDASGMNQLRNEGWASILINPGPIGTRIGTNGDGVSDSLERNVISGGNYNGIALSASQSIISGNYIGTNKTGTAAIPNRTGIWLHNGAQSNIVGADGDSSPGEAAEGNLISGNFEWGVVLADANTKFNRVAGNRLGTDSTGMSAVPNLNAVAIWTGASSNIIGTNGDGLGDANEGNLISGNNGHALYVASVGTNNNKVAGNLIGTDATGNAKLGNQVWANIFLETGPSDTLIGTNGDGVSDTLERNVISGASGYGIASRANYTTIAGNYIGTNREGTAAIPNPSDGVILFDGAKYSVVGVNSDGSFGESNEGNLISGNTNNGLQIQGSETKYNRVSGNRIGTNDSGANAIPNTHGIRVAAGASYNLIGTNSDGISDTFERNLVSGNVYHGIYFAESANRNQISGNWIGMDSTGQNALPNNWGIRMEQSQYNLVGSNGDGFYDTVERNIVSGNTQHGLSITDNSSNNQVSGNYIGTDPTGGIAIGNDDGIFIANGSSFNIIGGTSGSAGNLIGGNRIDGIRIVDSTTTSNVVQGNLIGVSGGSSPNGAVSWYRGEGNIHDAYDRNHGNFFNGTYVQGKVGQAFRFEGAQSLTIPYAESLVPGSGSFSAELWVKTTSQIRSTIMEQYECGGECNSGSGSTWRIVFEGQTAGIHLRDVHQTSQYYTGSKAINDGIYHHLALVRDVEKGLLNLYVDGVVDVSVPLTVLGYVGDADGDSDPITIGYHRPPYAAPGDVMYLTGDVDEPSVYSRALTAEEIAAIYRMDSAGKAGFSSLPNGRYGVWILNAPNQVVGGTTTPARNIIVASSVTDAAAVFINGTGATGNLVQGNFIGTNVLGTASLGGTSGVIILDASNNTVGGSAEARNIISGHIGHGVRIYGSSNDNRIQSNYIGTDPSGQSPVGNNNGIGIYGGSNNIIGTNGDEQSDSDEGNVISGNIRGILIENSNSNRISGNRIGADASGQIAIPNSLFGIQVYNSEWTVIGANGDKSPGENAEGNVISGNDGPGVRVIGSGSKNNSIVSNIIGSALGSESDLGNKGPGIYVDSEATATTIGGPNAPFGNMIAYNSIGIRLDGTAANLGTFRHNRFLNNDSIAIDAAAEGSTPNDNGDTDGLRNAPVITSVRRTDEVLIVEGYARPGTEFDLYQTKAYGSGLGQGQSFLARVFEGGLQDQDDTAGTYDASSVGGIPVGTDTTNRFRFVLPLESLQNPILAGNWITAIAADPTSEFGNQAAVDGGSLSDAERGPKGLTLSNTTIAELMAPGTIIGFLYSAGYELRPSWEYQYSLVVGEGSSDNGAFAILDNRLVSGQTFDYEQKSSYSIRLRVTDPANRTFERAFSIGITDAKEDGSGPYVVRANVSSSGVQANEGSQNGALSTDGRYLAYATMAFNTDPEKTNNDYGIIRKDLLTGETVFASKDVRGRSFYPSISGDGRYVLFGSSVDTGLGDGNKNESIFLFDAVAKKTQLVTSYQNAGLEGIGNLYQAPYAISADGRYVAFGLYGTPAQSAIRDGIYVKDMLTGTLKTVTQEAGVFFYYVSISADGSSVAVSRSEGAYIDSGISGFSIFNLSDGSRSDVPVRAQRVTQGWQTSLSSDGRYFAYMQNWEIYLHETRSGSNKKLSPGSFDGSDPNRTVAVAPSIDVNGRLVAYYGSVINSGVRNRGVFLYDIDRERTSHFEETFNPTSSFSTVNTMSIAANGSKVAIFSDRTDLVPDDTNGFRDMFVIDLVRPMVDMTIYASTLSESIPVGTTISDLRATDAFSNTISADYSLVSGSGGTDNDLFEIVQGQVKLKKTLDYETSVSHSIRVRATDAQGRWIERTFSIDVMDENEFTVSVPVDSDPTVNRVQATAAIGTTVGITAFSVDLDGSNNTITYSLDDSSGGLFSIDPLTGVVRVASSLAGVSSDALSITVRATSSDGSSKTAAFSIQLVGVVSIGGTPGNDQFIATQLGGNQWSIQRNGTVVFSGFVYTGGGLLIDGLDGTDALAVYGTASQDSFTINESSIVLNGFTVTGTSMESRSAWGMAMGDTFIINRSIQSIRGGDGQDRFVLANPTAIVGNLDAGTSYDTLDYSLQTGPISYTVGTSSAPGVTVMSSVDAIVASAGSDTLRGANVLTDWAVYGEDVVQINAIDFLSFENLQGGTATDRFQFWNATAKVSGMINGGGGTDRLTAFNINNAWQTTGVKTGSISSVASFTDIEALIGGGADDRFVILPGTSFSSVDGGGGNDAFDFGGYGSAVSVALSTSSVTAMGLFRSIESVAGSSRTDGFTTGNGTNSWFVDGVGSGQVSGIRFSSFELLRGGSGADTFKIVSGSIPNILGGAGSDTIIGPDVSNKWRISAAGSGSLNATTVFREFENATGGNGEDAFELTTSGTLSGILSGGDGTNSLSYQSFPSTRPVDINVTVNQATGLGTLASNFQVFIGGAGNDRINAFAGVASVLRGLGGSDTLTGSTARDILIGGGGSDTIYGGAGEDIVIGGSTSFDVNTTALLAIRNEWLSTRTYGQRIGNLRGTSISGAPLNNGYFLGNSPTDTIFSDSAVDTLFGQDDSDWFIAKSNDLLSDRLSDEQHLDPLGS